MKLNGALKPRQGASSRGSSPGVVLRKYRDKRFYKSNGNVVKGLPLSECGVKNYNYNNNNNYNYNKHQRQHKQQIKCAENPTSLCSSSVTNYNKNNNNYNKNNNNNNNNNTQYRITTTTAANIDYKSHGSRKVPAAAATTINHNIEDVVEFKQIPVHNITTRQVCKKNTINKETNNEKNKAQEREWAEVIRNGLSTATKLNTSKYHVTSNKTSNNNTSNNNILFRKGVNKFLLISKIYENLILCALTFLTVIISWLFIQLKLLLFCMCSRTEIPLTGYPVGGRSGCEIGGGGGAGRGGGAAGSGGISFANIKHNLSKIMRASQPFKELFDRICFKNVNKSRLPPSLALCMIVYAAAAILLPQPVVGDDGDNFYPINGLETTTPEFDYASRGQKKFGDKCDNTLECGFPGSICDPKKKSCQCTEDLPVTNHIDKCGKEAAVNESCFFNEQCEVKYFQTECRDQRCTCRFDMSPIWLKDGTVECKGRGEKKPERYLDPAMIGVLIGMALMFIIICVVLRLFSQARWRENRTIFNTPNPRLMNVSLLRESKLLHGQERRGSRMSVRAPSRQPSMASLRPHSPNPSLGKTGSRSNSHGSSVSATSLRSTRSNSVSPAGIVVNNTHHERKGSTYQPHHHHPTHQHQHQHQPPPPPQQQQQEDEQEHEQKQPLTQTNITSNPVAESITVEIIEPEK